MTAVGTMGTRSRNTPSRPLHGQIVCRLCVAPESLPALYIYGSRPAHAAPDRGDNEYYRCEECSAEFYESFIMTNFKVCTAVRPFFVAGRGAAC
jgi:hypothetical protein